MFIVCAFIIGLETAKFRVRARVRRVDDGRSERSLPYEIYVYYYYYYYCIGSCVNAVFGLDRA